jgi:hypothetical protein
MLRGYDIILFWLRRQSLLFILCSASLIVPDDVED